MRKLGRGSSVLEPRQEFLDSGLYSRVYFAEREPEMLIGSVAKKIGLTRDAIRFYERSALLPHPMRTAGGFRRYTENDVDTLEFIRQAQGLGFTLKEVGELLKLRWSRLQPCAPVRGRLERKLAQVRGNLASLRTLERELKAALRDCNRGVQKRSARCPLLSRSMAHKAEKAK